MKKLGFLFLLLVPFFLSGCGVPFLAGGVANSLNGPPRGRTLAETVALRQQYLASQSSANPLLKELHDPKARLLKAFELLGKKYAKRYQQDLVDEAVTEVKKMSAGRKLILEAQKTGILGDCVVETSDKSKPDEDLLMLSTELTKSYIVCDIKDSKALQDLIKKHSILLKTPIKNKVNYWWAYVDSNGIPTWRQYFYLALFEEYGLQPAIFDNYIVLGYFLKKEDALALQQAIPELDIQVAYVLYEEFEVLKKRPKRRVKRRTRSLVRHGSRRRKPFKAKKVPVKLKLKGEKLILKSTLLRRVEKAPKTQETILKVKETKKLPNVKLDRVKKVPLLTPPKIGVRKK